MDTAVQEGDRVESRREQTQGEMSLLIAHESKKREKRLKSKELAVCIC